MNFSGFSNKYFKDSYGWDKFSLAIIALALLLLIISKWAFPLSIALAGFAAWRSFSKDKYKRSQEEAVFESFIYRMNYKIRGLKTKISQSINYKILTCPNCSQKLRVPRHKGKITVTCKNCHNEFKSKS